CARLGLARSRAPRSVGPAATAPALHHRARVHAPPPGPRPGAPRRAAVRPVGARALPAPDRLRAELSPAAAIHEARPAHERPGARAVRGRPPGDRRARRRRPALPGALRDEARRGPWRQGARGADHGVKRVRVAAAVVWDGERLLMTQRPPGGALALQWEFPGGKIEPAETPEQAIVREVHEELGVRAMPQERLETVSHDSPPGLRVETVFVRCTLDSHAFVPGHGVHATRWLEPAAIELSNVLEADRGFLRLLGGLGA